MKVKNIRLWDWVVRVKDTGSKATYKIKDLELLNAFSKIGFQCMCRLTDTSCFTTYKMESYRLKCKKRYRKHRSRTIKY